MKLNYTSSVIHKDKLKEMMPSIKKSHELLKNKTGLGKDLLGWMDLPDNYDKDEFQRIKDLAGKIQMNSDALIVIGVGGSYLGARACVEALSNSFHNLQQKEHRKVPEVYYAGNNISSTYLMHLIDLVKDKDISINVISKSGTTIESAISFRIFKNILEDKYGVEGAKDRIYITTNKSKGALSELAELNGYETFSIPDNIGGRYSVFTAVGLLPMAIMGIDIDKIMDGVYSAMIEYDNLELDENISYQYAAIRNILYEDGKDIEILANYEPRLHYLSEWWRQLFGESEGKDGKGIYPSSANYTTDLHSFGQLVQDGKRNIFQTIIQIENPKKDMILESNEDDFDKLNYLSGKTIDYINKSAFRGALKAHEMGGVPNIVITLPVLNEFYMGKLMYFFQKSCAMSAYILGVNPFDQPAVEEYKINMYENLQEKDI